MPVLADRDVARLFGFDPENRDHRYKARRALERLHGDGVIEVERVKHSGGGVRLFAPGRRGVS